MSLQNSLPTELSAPVKIRVMVVDDQPAMIQFLGKLVDSSTIAEVVATATSGKLALQTVSAHRPDLVLLDVSMPEMSGAQTARLLKHDYPELKILAVSAYNNQIYISEMLSAGASGYLLKDVANSELSNAMATLHQGGRWISQIAAD